MVMGLTGNCSLLPLPNIEKEDWPTYHWPGKIAKFKIRTTVSTECVSLCTIVKSKNFEVSPS